MASLLNAQARACQGMILLGANRLSSWGAPKLRSLRAEGLGPSPQPARRLWAWGCADHGRCADGGTPDAPIFVKELMEPEKVKQPSIPSDLIKQVVCGGAHTLLVTASGRILSCGLGEQGQLGRGNRQSDSLLKDVEGLEPVVGASAGHWHSVAVGKSGKVYSWGRNKHGQLGILPDPAEESTLYSTPQTVSVLRATQVTEVACGGDHTLACTKDGEVYSWGMGNDGKLGHGTDDGENLPKRIDALRGERIISVAAGWNVSAAISEDGRLWMWGLGDYWQLGLGDRKSRSLPTLVPVDAHIKQVAIGGFHSAAVTQKGSLYTWGVFEGGALGHGNTGPNALMEPDPIIEPKQLRNAKQVSCGERHTIVVTGYGDVFAFGHGQYGKLGTGSDLDLYVPTQIKSFMGKSLRQVACGINHSAAF